VRSVGDVIAGMAIEGNLGYSKQSKIDKT